MAPAAGWGPRHAAPAEHGTSAVHAPTSADDYRVRLDAFEGPLDLLLYLVRRAEVDITDIPIARIADQYLDYLSRAQRIDVETAGEFLVMAATLVEIKARMVSPAIVRSAPDEPDADPDEPPSDPRTELVQQLLEYKRFADAADALDRRRQAWSRRWPVRIAPARTGPGEALAPEDTDPDELELVDLISAFARVREAVDFDRLGAHEVVTDETPLEVYADEILARLRSARDDGDGSAAAGPAEVALARFFADRPLGQVIGVFLALLELVRRGAVTVRQEDDGRILVALSAAREASWPASGADRPGPSSDQPGLERPTGQHQADETS